MEQRRRLTQLLSLQERLDQESSRLLFEARKLPHGAEREMLIRKARQAGTAMHIDKWLSSPGLRVPR
jgi:hypothetical protein